MFYWRIRLELSVNKRANDERLCFYGRFGNLKQRVWYVSLQELECVFEVAVLSWVISDFSATLLKVLEIRQLRLQTDAPSLHQLVIEWAHDSPLVAEYRVTGKHLFLKWTINQSWFKSRYQLFVSKPKCSLQLINSHKSGRRNWVCDQIDKHYLLAGWNCSSSAVYALDSHLSNQERFNRCKVSLSNTSKTNSKSCLSWHKEIAVKSARCSKSCAKCAAIIVL